MRKILFCDFGGTLNSGAPTDEKTHTVDAEAVERLDEICRRTGARVVVSSSWRRWMSLNRIRAMLRRHGFTGRVVGKTPSLYGGRNLEIKTWLTRHRDPTRRGPRRAIARPGLVVGRPRRIDYTLVNRK